MPAVAQVVADRFIGHQVNLLRLADSERESIFRMLGSLQTALLQKMDAQIPLPGFATFKRQKLQALFILTDRLIQQRYSQIDDRHQSGLIDLAGFEVRQTTKLVNNAVGVPLLSVGVPLPTLKALASDDLVEGRPASEWWAQQSDNLRGRYQQTIRQGVFAGETLDQLKQRVRGTKSQNYQDGIMAVTSRDADALIRTSTLSVANAARYETLRANDDVLGGQQWLSTLDPRTCEICMALSGQAWDFDGNPIGDTTQPFPGPPPEHFNCRCVLTPVLKSWSQLQKDAKEDATLGKKLDTIEEQIGKGTQASMDGQVAADLDFADWLKTKPDEFQKQVLGDGRWQLWRRGVIELRDLIDQRGRPLTLNALRAEAGVPSSPPTPVAPVVLPPVPSPAPDPIANNPWPRQRDLAVKAVASIKRNPDSGVNGSTIVTFTDQTKGVFKPLADEEPSLRDGIQNYYLREALATDIAQLVRYTDLVPTTATTIIRKETGSIQAFVPGAMAARHLVTAERFGQSPRDVRRAILFDAIMGNTDRHAGNWMVTNAGKLVLVDHGLTLSTKNARLHIGFLDGLQPGLRQRAIPESMKKPWQNVWPKLETTLQARGIEPQAIALVKRRLDRLLRPGTTWQDMEGAV